MQGRATLLKTEWNCKLCACCLLGKWKARQNYDSQQMNVFLLSCGSVLFYSACCLLTFVWVMWKYSKGTTYTLLLIDWQNVLFPIRKDHNKAPHRLWCFGPTLTLIAGQSLLLVIITIKWLCVTCSLWQDQINTSYRKRKRAWQSVSYTHDKASHRRSWWWTNYSASPWKIDLWSAT